MSTKITSLIGMSFKDFQNIIKENKLIHAQPANLIPIYKIGDEKPLTSIFLSSLILIDEFSKAILSKTSLSKGGKIYVYTEVNFTEIKESQPDGLVLIVKSGIIKDAALFEVKNKNVVLKEEQILRYFEIAKKYKIQKFITISNQFVSTPTQTPLNLRVPKDIELFHLSWSDILTEARILLYDNETNIKDPDQIKIMNEIVNYFENPSSGVTGFTTMKPGWKNISQKFRTGSNISKKDPDAYEAVSSWLQETQDMALLLSRKIGAKVYTGKSKYKYNLNLRINEEVENLIKNKILISHLNIKKVNIDIKVSAHFVRGMIKLEVNLTPPDDRQIKAQITWINKQIMKCMKNEPELFLKFNDEIKLYIYLKNHRSPKDFKLDQIDEAWKKLKNYDIKAFGIVQEKDIPRNFDSSKKFVEIIEEMLIDYYKGIIQYLEKWQKPNPKIVEKDENQMS